MKTTTTIHVKRIIRLSVFSLLMVAVVALAFASKGGGGKKKTPIKNDFVPVRTTSGFTLRTGVNYSGSHIFGVERNDRNYNFNTVITYQKGNTTFIVPYKYKVNAPSLNMASFKTNFQLLNLKISIHK
jgi:hypothetical protein